MRYGLEIREGSIPGLKVLDRGVVSDHRGFLERLFSAHEFRPLMGDRPIAQVNRSLTQRRGTVRGMHFQSPPHAELKLVTCLRGRVFDVAVDVRHDSATFLRWHAELLDASEHTSLLIPEGFAHGFQALSDDCEMLYFHTAAYEPSAEGGLNPKDPGLSIAWPEEVVELSARDSSFPLIASGFDGVHL